MKSIKIVGFVRAISSNFFKFLAQRRQGAKFFSFLAFASKEKAFAEHCSAKPFKLDLGVSLKPA